MPLAIDTRNSKFQARVNHTLVAASNKSYNYKSYMKMLSKREIQREREDQRYQEALTMQAIRVDNKKWQPVDEEDARHMKKEAEKRRKQAEKTEKKREKEMINRIEEEKEEKGKKLINGWGKVKK